MCIKQKAKLLNNVETRNCHCWVPVECWKGLYKWWMIWEMAYSSDEADKAILNI